MIGLLIITHNNIGAELVKTATLMLGMCPLMTQALPVTPSSDPDAVLRQAQRHLIELNSGDGVLVLTDMYGSTPSNIAAHLANENQVKVVAGINLPMLVRVLNYPQLDLKDLANKALSGGRDGILLCKPLAEA
jgi:mannose PTS system EIIA component